MLQGAAGNVLAHRVETLFFTVLSSPTTETEYHTEYTMARTNDILQIHYM